VEIDTLFGSNGPLARALPGYELRPEQARMARELMAAFRAGHHLIVEAGTGVGKSLAYLVPAILWATRAGAAAEDRTRVVVSTHTRALQEQLAHKDLPILERALRPEGIEFRHALLMGSENYLCVQRLHEARLRSGETRDRRRAHLLSLLDEHARTAPTGLRSEVPFPVADAIWSQVRRDRDICLGLRGPFWESCLYRRDLGRSREAHLLVVNHALFLLDVATGGRILPPHGVAILDESHRLEEMAVSQFGITVSDTALTRLLGDLKPWSSGRLPTIERGRGAVSPHRDLLSLQEAIPRLDEESRRFFEEVRDRAGAEPIARIRRPGLVDDRLKPRLQEIEESLEAAAEGAVSQEEALALAALAARSGDLRERLDLFLTQRMEDAVYWVEAPRGRRSSTTLRVTPVEVAPILRQFLFEGDRTVALTSATLSTTGSFTHVKRRLGITAAREVILGSPFDYDRQALLYLPPSMPEPGAAPDAYAEAVAEECRRLLIASDGGAFILLTSYALLHRVHDILTRHPSLRSLRFFRHEPGQATSILEEFRMTRRGVLVGTMSFWQGVDVPGEALRAVIITRLPFEVPDHPLAEARAECLRSRGGDPFTDDALPEAILTLRQGFGRLIRTREDRGVVAVLDPRVLTRAYGAAFLESLPPCPRTDSIEEVARFLSPSTDPS
jgi:ATP-dependent DNA helicase DinG